MIDYCFPSTFSGRDLFVFFSSDSPVRSQILITSYGLVSKISFDKSRIPFAMSFVFNSFFRAAVVSIQLYECTTWALTKRMEKKLDGNCTRMLRAILNKSWRQHPTKQQLYGHLPPITKTIKVRRTRHAGYYWRSTDELISDVLLWTPSHGRVKAGRQLAPTYSSSVRIRAVALRTSRKR